MARLNLLQNTYKLDNGQHHLTETEVDRLLSDFEFFMGNYQQILNKARQTVPFKLNHFQKKLFKVLLPMIMPETRLERRHNVVILKPRQVGASVGVVAFINYLCAFVEGLNHMRIIHTFPVKGALERFYRDKVQPIVTGVHPDVFPVIEKISSGTSIYSLYHNIKGIERDNGYELISANSESIRSTTATIWIADEAALYTHPYDLEAALSPALPQYGFSLVVYLSTFNEGKSDYFTKKIETAIAHPEDWTLVFTPWYESYPEKFYGVDINDLELTQYDQNRIIPALAQAGISPDTFGDYIDWYHRTSAETAAMITEFPTTIEEVQQISANEKIVPREDMEKIKAYKEEGQPYKLLVDPVTNRTEARKTDVSMFKVFRMPRKGERYIMAVDPIMASGDNTDFFAASVFNSKHEQVATLRGRGLPLEDWATYAIGICRLYNNALICPEQNVMEGFRATVWAKGYYYWWYATPKDRANRTPGLRTTVSTKERMIEKLLLLIHNERIIIHDEVWLHELEIFERIKKVRSGGEVYYQMRAPKSDFDDAVASLWIYAGTLNQNELTEQKSKGWTIL